MSTAQDPSFAVGGDPCHLAITGDLDLESKAAFDAAMDRLADACPDGPIVLDVSGVSFLDSSGLSVLVAHATVGRPIILRRAPESVRRLIQATGLDEIIEVEP